MFFYIKPKKKSLKILILSALFASAALSAVPAFSFAQVASGNPTPKITLVCSPSEIHIGDYTEVYISVRNEGYHGSYLLLQTTTPIASYSEENSQLLSSSGIDIWNLSDFTNVIHGQTPVDGQWNAGTVSGFKVKFKPESIGSFKVSVNAASGNFQDDKECSVIVKKKGAPVANDNTTVPSDFSANSKPQITGPQANHAYNLKCGQSFLVQAMASDPENRELFYSLPESPSEMTVDPTGLMQWTPAGSYCDTNYRAKLCVSNLYDGDCSQAMIDFTINVAAGPNQGNDRQSNQTTPPPAAQNQKPWIAQPAPNAVYNLQCNQNFSLQAAAKDNENDKIHYSFSENPSSMQISQNGLIQWTPSGNKCGTQSKARVCVYDNDSQTGIDRNCNWIFLNVGSQGGQSNTSNPAPSCSNQCSSGEKRCNGNGYQICYNNGFCNIWSSLINCDQAQVCRDGNCVTVASCRDGIRNQNEVDIDCGGSCGDCSNGKRCYGDGDCQSGKCQNNVCAAYSNPSESVASPVTTVTNRTNIAANPQTASNFPNSNANSGNGYINSGLLIPRTFTFQNYLGLGSQNAQVYYLQKLLNYLNYTVAYTGNGSPNNETYYFGNLTQLALIKFQRTNYLSASGVLDTATRASLNNELAGKGQSSSSANSSSNNPNNWIDPLYPKSTGYTGSVNSTPVMCDGGVCEGYIDIVDPVNFVVEVGRTTWNEAKDCMAKGDTQECLSTCGVALDVTVVTAPISAACDLANGAIYLYNGDKVSAGASLFAVVPYAGTVGKQTIKGVKLSKEASEAVAKKMAKESLAVKSLTSNLKNIADEVKYTSEDIWQYGPLQRGQLGDIAFGNNAGRTAMTIDYFEEASFTGEKATAVLEDGVVKSFKTLDQTTQTYQDGNRMSGRIKSDLNKLNDYPGGYISQNNQSRYIIFGKDFTKKVFKLGLRDINLSDAQIQAVNDARAHAKKLNIEFIVTVLKQQ